MICSCTTLFLTLTNLAGTGMFVACGYLALDKTLWLLEKYGPPKGRGNPALDPPPQYWVNPKTNQWEPISINDRGNLVPQVFAGVQYYLIALAVFMTINSIVFLVDSVRSKKAVNDRHYQGKRTGLSRISCTGWLAGYSVFLALMWLVMACFAVIPILMWRITMQRCWDLDSSLWSPGTYQGICVNLVQYGMVFFKETQDTGYALICGPGGNYNPPLGDLRGLCDNYYTDFVLYLVALVGAGVGLISMVLFSARHTSNFVYLKIRRWERPYTPPDYSTQPDIPYVKSLPNPNYEHNVILLNPNEVPNDVDVGSYDHRMSPVGEAFEMDTRRYDEGGDGDYRSRSRTSKRYSRRSSCSPDEEPPPVYYRSSSSIMLPRKRSDETDSEDEKRHRRHSRRHRRQSNDDLSSRDGRRSTASSHRPKAKRRARDAQSDPDVSRRSILKKSHDEYDSPPSDYYMQEDFQRQQSSRS